MARFTIVGLALSKPLSFFDKIKNLFFIKGVEENGIRVGITYRRRLRTESERQVQTDVGKERIHFVRNKFRGSRIL